MWFLITLYGFQFLNEPLREASIFEYEEHKLGESSPVRDELQKAVLDFEDTLQRSQNSTLKKHSGTAIYVFFSFT